tara:strand:+ start:285 stop:464 length:180 start_codon:yes stop_codon:yes gene_type:complete
MKYKLHKIDSISAINDWHGLGKDNAKKLEAGKEVELKDPPESLVNGGYLKEVKSKKESK